MEKKLLGLRTTIYRVADIPEATAWYTKAFATAPYFEEPFYVGFDIGGYELGLQPGAAAQQPEQADVVAYWGTSDIDAAYAHFLAVGATAHEAPNEVGGGIYVATVIDPWGNAIGLILNPHFKLGG